jgi:hypothetical protein
MSTTGSVANELPSRIFFGGRASARPPDDATYKARSRRLRLTHDRTLSMHRTVEDSRGTMLRDWSKRQPR